MNINFKVKNKNITIDVDYGHKLTRDTIIEKAGLSVYTESRSFNDHIVLSNGKFDDGYPCYEDSEITIDWGIEMGGQFAPINSPINLTIKVKPEEVIEVAAQFDKTVPLKVTEFEKVERLNDHRTRYQSLISLGEIPGEYSIPPLEFKLPEGNLIDADLKVIPMMGNRLTLDDKNLVDVDDVEFVNGYLNWTIDQESLLPFGNNPDDIYGLTYILELEEEAKVVIKEEPVIEEKPAPVEQKSGGWENFLQNKKEEKQQETIVEEVIPKDDLIQDFSKKKDDPFGLNIDEALPKEEVIDDHFVDKKINNELSGFKEVVMDDEIPSFRQMQAPVNETENKISQEFQKEFKEIGVADNINTESDEVLDLTELGNLPDNGKKGKKTKKVKEPKVKKEKGEKNNSKVLKISIISGILFIVMGIAGAGFWNYNSSMKSIEKEVAFIEKNQSKTEKLLKEKELDSSQIDELSQLLNSNQEKIIEMGTKKDGKEPGYFVAKKRGKLTAKHNKLIGETNKKLSASQEGTESTDSSN